MSIIEDGRGKGNVAEVTVNRRLKTTGVDLTLIEAATETGDTYNLHTDEITLTGTGESGLFYIKNAEDTNIIINQVVINIKDYAGTDGQPEFVIYRDPTSGTLIANTVAASSQNRNFGSAKTLDALLYQGVDGDTIVSTATNKILVYLPTTAASTFAAFDTITVLPKGASFAISYTPPSGMTSMKIIVAINVTLNGTQL